MSKDSKIFNKGHKTLNNEDSSVTLPIEAELGRAESQTQPKITMNEHKRVMQNYSPKLVSPDFSFASKTNQVNRKDVSESNL